MRWGNEADAWAAVSVCKAAPPELLLPRFIRPRDLLRQCYFFEEIRKPRLKFREDQANPAHNIVCRRLMGPQRENLNRKLEGKRPQNQLSLVELQVTKDQAGARADGIFAAFERRVHQSAGRLRAGGHT